MVIRNKQQQENGSLIEKMVNGYKTIRKFVQRNESS